MTMIIATAGTCMTGAQWAAANPNLRIDSAILTRRICIVSQVQQANRTWTYNLLVDGQPGSDDGNPAPLMVDSSAAGTDASASGMSMPVKIGLGIVALWGLSRLMR